MKKRILTFVLSLVMILSCVMSSALVVCADDAVVADETWDADTDGNYRIYDAADLLAFANALYSKKTDFANVKVYLCNDVVLNEGDASTWGTTAPTNSYSPYQGYSSTAWFAGTFDGQGYVISGLYCTTKFTGLIPLACDNATIKNVTITNSYFASSNSNYTSAITAEYKASVQDACFTVENVHVENTHVNNGTGAVAGILTFMNGASVTGAKINMNNVTFVGGEITGGRESGGIIGKLYQGSSYDYGVVVTMDKVVVNSALTFTNTKTDGSSVRSGGVIGYVNGFRGVDMTNIMIDGSLTISGTNTGSTPFVGEVRSNCCGDETDYAELNISNALAAPQMTNVEAYLSSRTDAAAYPKITMSNIYSDDDKAGDTSSRKTNQGTNDVYPGGSDHKKTTNDLIGKQLFDGWMITSATSYPVPTARPARLLGYQTSYATDVTDANDANETYSVRLIAALNDTFYTYAGFENITITYTDGEGNPVAVPKDDYRCKYAYNNVLGVDKNGVEQTYAASDYYAEHLIALEITGIPESVTEFTITLNAFAGKEDVSFAGITRTVQVSAQ